MGVKWGAHLSKDGSFLGALNQALQYGCTAIQVFAHSPYSYFVEKNFPLEDAKQFGLKAKENGITLVFHSAFFVNLASPRANIYAVSQKSLISDMRLAQQCNVPYVVTHIGSYTKQSNYDIGKKQIIDALNHIAKASKTEGVMLLLETHAGGGTAYGGNVLALIEIIKATDPETQKIVGICLDTAHTFAAGYNLDDPVVVGKVLEEAGSFLRLVHFNNPDPNVALGSHLDRHRCTMQTGALPERAMKDLFNSLKQYPLILERPNDDSKHPSEDISVLDSDLKTLGHWVRESEKDRPDVFGGAPEVPPGDLQPVAPK